MSKTTITVDYFYEPVRAVYQSNLPHSMTLNIDFFTGYSANIALGSYNRLLVWDLPYIATDNNCPIDNVAWVLGTKKLKIVYSVRFRKKVK